MSVLCHSDIDFPDPDNPYSLRQTDNTSRSERRYDAYPVYDQMRSGQQLPSNRSNYEPMHRNGHSTYPREQLGSDQLATARKVRTDIDQPERSQVLYRPPAQFTRDETPDTNRQSHLSDQSRINYTIPQNSSGSSRSIVLDINITINVGGNRNPQVTATAQTIPRRLSPPRSTAILEDIGFVDLDIRSPERTARLVTDGSIRSSPPQQFMATPQPNPK